VLPGAGVVCLLLKEGVVCGALRRRENNYVCGNGNKTTTPTATKEICAFFFTGLDRSRLTNLDRSRFEKERNQ